MDVRAVKAAGEKAVQWAATARGPIILEMLTYRYRGHSMSDPAKYRTSEEVRRCAPSRIRSSRCAARLLERGLVSEDAFKKIDAAVRDIVNEAAEFATNDPEPDPSELWTDVYAGPMMAIAAARIDRGLSRARGRAVELDRRRLVLCAHASCVSQRSR